MSHEKNPFYKALELRYAADLEDAKAKILLYFTQPQGVADHSDVSGEIDKQMGRLADATEKVYQLRAHFGPQSRSGENKANDGKKEAEDTKKAALRTVM
tara:strand:- start:77 stop:373 length:297 start_codon:yes stop_codon:yes gene_type:complete